MHQQGWAHGWYVDDVLLLGSSQAEVTSRAIALIHLLENLGMRVNTAKTMTTPQQQVTYLGHRIDLANHTIRPILEKTQPLQKFIKRQLTRTCATPRTLAATAGSLMDAVRSNSRLMGLPQQIAQAAAQGVATNRKRGKRTQHACWETPVTTTPTLRLALHKARNGLQQPTAQVLRPANDHAYTLYTDASPWGWGASLQHAQLRREIATTAQHWTSRQKTKHITHLEALASAQALQTLLHHIPKGAALTIRTDSTPVAWAWTKGSKIPGMNDAIARARNDAHMRGIHIKAVHIAGVDNTRADWLSRHPDPQSYRLKPEMYRYVCHRFHYYPTLDLFASRHNRQCFRYCSRHPDLNSQGNAFAVPWARMKLWLNPPWEIIHRVLLHLQAERARALVCLPHWPSASWWPLVVKMHAAPLFIVKGYPLYADPEDKPLPTPRWGTLFTILQG
jgi:hypothetical protein